MKNDDLANRGERLKEERRRLGVLKNPRGKSYLKIFSIHSDKTEFAQDSG